ncbi:MAG: GNAT family N-acetyltransferase [Pirellulaceae bacterium]|nr:GNAT family N-acetyltransferase [Planctomycetales bacterium]
MLPILFRFSVANFVARSSAPRDVVLGHFRDETDIGGWLQLRERAFAGQLRQPRAWSDRDFRREFLAQSWWSPDRMWFCTQRDGAIVGTVTRGQRRVGTETVATVHWLLVAPQCQRQGMASFLFEQVVRDCCRHQITTLYAETLDTWMPAVRFYERMGGARVPSA